MALSFYTNTTSATVCGTALTEVTQAGYTVSDDLQLRKAGSDTYTSCASQGRRTRQFTVNNEELLTAWAGFTAGIDATNTFDLSGYNCDTTATDTLALALGSGCGSSFSFSADGNTVVEITTTVDLLGDPSFHD